MKFKQIIITLLLTVVSTSLFAHALWIETLDRGTIGKMQEIKIFYGEYAAKEFEPVTGWYSDVNTFSLWVLWPDGSKKQLQYSAADNHYTASFTPEKEGTYVITTGHSAKEIDGVFVYQFNASAIVTVGKATENATAISNNELYLQPMKSTKTNHGAVKAFFKGKPAANLSITVSGPTGWSKTFTTDANGILEFDLLWKGSFALEGSLTVDEKGTHHDKPYEKIWRCATIRMFF